MPDTMDQNYTLRECPFCGSFGEFNRGGFGEIQVRCSNKGCQAGLGPSCWQTDEAMAARAWNRRYTPSGR